MCNCQCAYELNFFLLTVCVFVMSCKNFKFRDLHHTLKRHKKVEKFEILHASRVLMTFYHFSNPRRNILWVLMYNESKRRLINKLMVHHQNNERVFFGTSMSSLKIKNQKFVSHKFTQFLWVDFIPRIIYAKQHSESIYYSNFFTFIGMVARTELC